MEPGPQPAASILPDQAALVRAILPGYQLERFGIHGLSHWARVLETGLRIAERNGADARVVTLFALLHDARRENNGRDPRHGERGALYAREQLRGSLIFLEDAAFDLFDEACARHTDGLTTSEPTIQACWDADRLDLPRVGIAVNPRLLSSAAAVELIPWAGARAVRRWVPPLVNEVWEE